jgi:5-methyltetrahydrofolate--homocysteine methyltransferase
MLGGAALSRHYCESHLRSIYNGPLYYGRDAFDGLRIFNLLAENRSEEVEQEIEARLEKRANVEAQVAESRARTREGASSASAAVAVAPSPLRVIEPPTVPFLGSRLVESIPLDEVLPFINEVALFRGQWGFKKGNRSAEEYKEYVEETVRPIFRRLGAWMKDESVLDPKVVYGFFECAADGDDLVVFDPEDGSSERERFPFPRQEKRDRRSISDYFAPLESGRRDLVGFHCVTVGSQVSVEARRLFEANEYQEYLFVHGFGVECAEGLAELWHKRMRAELGIGTEDSPRIRELFQQKYRGCRYSFGYPACPDMSHQEKLFRLLEPQRIGCRLTENWQIDPEQSTSALIVHHPEAKYFTV